MKGLVDIGRQRKLLILCLFIGNVAADCPIPEHGEFTVLTEESILKHRFPDGTVITHECRLGYEKVSGTGKMTCVNGKWTELDIKCRRKDCGPPVPQPHMIFNLRQGTLYGAHAYITCEKGYTVMGWGYRICLGTRWVGHGNCSIVNCSKPTKVENGEHTWRTRKAPHYNQKIHFSCHKGYTLIGNKTIRCTHTGRYDSKQPQCIAFCPIPDVGVNIILTKESLLKKDFPSGTELRYECIIGYKNVNGTGIMTCDDGNWTKPDIICRKKDCGHLEAQPHMLYDTSQGTLFGAAVYVSCVKGFRLIGSRVKHCVDTGWFGTANCVVVSCPKPTRVENGIHSWNNVRKPEYQQTIHFACKKGYSLVGNKTIRCTETGGYDSEPPRCVLVTCPKPTRVENGRHSWNNVRKPEYRQTIHFTCNTGYNLVGNEIIRCTETGEYDSQPPRCVIVTCPKPTRVENGKHSWNNDLEPEYRQTIRFTCNTGYNLVGNETIRCTVTGGYDSQPPRCVGDCPKPQHVQNTVLSAESLRKSIFPIGTVIKYQCIDGSDQISGTGINRCVNGKWTKPDIICKRSDCGVPEAKPHMSFDTSHGTIIGAVATVICEEGYRVSGSRSKQCVDEGWFGIADCIPVSCSKPIKVENGEHSWNSDREPEYRDTIHFTCDAGYTLFGNETITCTESAEYDSEPPRCVRNCPIPKSVENMVLTNESLLREDFPDGTKVTYECANGFEKESGSEIITCIDGTWTEPDLICKKIEPPLNLLLIGVAVGCSLALLFCIFWVWRRCSDDSEG